ncbi:glycosyltransferase family 4 protein [Candidatus Oscillochloris fontis]|uniref:glycosyltransferase family 4 protein n=1 Tax=Candidatus Oscillochloris fontis TaxID=2496868 RepID=UPI00101B93E3|nr:glycosyltransferase family 4 protein [Candidatus Oscillochloris fontis]
MIASRRILHLSFSDTYDGAGRAAYRLHTGLQAHGYDSHMLVQHRHLHDPSVHAAPRGRLRRYLPTYLDHLPLLVYPQRQIFAGWSVGWRMNRLPRLVAAYNPDIIHLHWVGNGYLPIRALAAFGRPLVWTLHDMGPFTGGCHYDAGCGRYAQGCGACPQLGSCHPHDLSAWSVQQKRAAWADLPLTLVAPSQWMAACARCSPILAQHRCEVIPNGLDLHRFHPQPKAAARAALGLPLDRDLLLFGANNSLADPRKGAAQLEAALHQAGADGHLRHSSAVIFGAVAPATFAGLPTHSMGYLNDEVRLAQLYAAADLFIAPSVQDNFPNMVLEALACGTPVVAFAVGGLPDMIQHQQSGYLAQPGNPRNLANGIAWVLAHREHLTPTARTFDLAATIHQHSKLYQNLSDVTVHASPSL